MRIRKKKSVIRLVHNSQHFVNRGTARSLRPRGAPEGPALPPGWEQFADDYGRHYFYHEKLGVTQWERPVLEVPASVPPVELR